MFKHLWVERGKLSGLTKKNCILVIVINNEPILSSMLAAGIVQDTFAGEAGEGKRGGEVETTGGYFYHPVGNSSRSVAIEFLSQITNTRTRIINVRTYVYIYTYIYIYENLDLDD